ncbi:MAG TPA: tetratricopeptide repeat protein [Candidatus Polarisedimenticolaceae bacterium]|nr:tetratricopeptide repeat protein [Candidatus Polarisedimenticolaceae bacterium]
MGRCEVGVAAEDPALPVIGQGSLAKVRKSRRGPWRAAVLIGVHAIIAIHITHFLMTRRSLSPVEPSESMYTLELGTVNAGFVFFGIALLATLIFGRFFCGWGCHIVALQDFCAWIMKRLGIRPRPFRARLLAWTPAVVAFYMFAWPSLVRLLSSPRAPFPGFTSRFMTTDLWATFPGPVFTVLTYAVCGFAAVYFLGAKGFCTYGCPYGSLFGALDFASPGRIVVSDACEQCGHCTASCTSNVRVHEEVRLYGMVVDTGCMKCTDCISVCPKGALSFSFAKPALLKGPAPAPRAKRYDLSLGEEIAVAAVAAASILVFRDLYDGPPLLLSVGLGGITAFTALKLWHLVRRPSARLQSLELKSSGRVTSWGRGFAVLTVLWLLFTAHSAFAQWHRAWGRYDLERTEVNRADGLSGAFRAKAYSPAHARALESAYRHFALADRVGLAGVVDVKLGLAWCHLLRGEIAPAIAEARAAEALAPGRDDLRKNVQDLEAAAAAGHFAKANELVDAGKLEEAATEYAACLATAPDSAPARFNLGGVLRRLGRNDEATSQLEQAAALAPDDADVMVELGLAYQATGASAKAIASYERAIALAPESPEAKEHLPELIRELKK